MEGILANSLQLAVQLFSVTSHDALVDKLGRYLTLKRGFDDSLASSLSAEAQFDRRELRDLNAKDMAEARRDPLAFVGDVPTGPPWGWVVLFGGRYANICGEHVPQVARAWGYVMWDRQRWAGAGALLAKQWSTFPELVREIFDGYGWLPSLKGY